jgi:hypothetical protein
MKIQHGGIIIKDKDPEKAFHSFIKNRSYLHMISKTPTSVLLECTLNRDVLQNSPYLMLRPEDYKSPVNCILIKLGLVVTNIENINNNERNYIDKFINLYFQMREKEKNKQKMNSNHEKFKNYNISGSKQNFIDEINIQTDVFLKTIDYLDPICPGVVYGNVIDDMNESIKFISDLQKGCGGETDRVLTELQKVFGYLYELSNKKKTVTKIIQDSINGIRGDKSPSQLTNEDINNLNLVYYMAKILLIDESSKFNIGLGIIAMEFVDNGYKTFGNLYNDILVNGSYKDQVLNYENMARLKLIDLALKTGYSQCDFHWSNIMINPTLPGYYEGYEGRVMLIDFGYAKKIPFVQLAEIKDSYENQDYMNCIKIIFGLGRIDGDPKNIFEDYIHLFGWIPHLYSNLSQLRIENTSEILNTLNKEIGSLIIAQEEAIDNRIKMFDDLHEQFKGEGIYPLLPLSNQIKNNLFKGMIKEGGRRRKNKKHRTQQRHRKSRKFKKSKTYKKAQEVAK